MNDHKTSTPTLVSALRILAGEIQSDDGVANMTIAEAADRIDELVGYYGEALALERNRAERAEQRNVELVEQLKAYCKYAHDMHPDTELMEWLFCNTIIAGPDGHVIDCRDDANAARKQGGAT